MTPNTYDFKGKAILCETNEQLLHLYELAKSKGLPVRQISLNNGFIDEWYFCKSGGEYCNWVSPVEVEEIISYADFITQDKPVPSWQQTHASMNC